MKRREFVQNTALAAAGWALSRAGVRAAGPAAATEPGRLTVHVFSKHLQFLDYADLGKVAADLGFDGVDLAVRRGGHVEPATVARDLPRAAEALQAAGLPPKLFVSDVTDAIEPASVAVLETAARLGFKAYRMGYYSFIPGVSWRENLDRHRVSLAALAALNARLGLHGAYQNHAGRRVGAYLPDLAYLLEGVDPRWLGCQFDLRHAVVEGGTAWPAGLEWLLPHIRTIPVKDFRWVQRAGGLQVENVPLGEGVVDFPAFFRVLRRAGITPEVSLHLEYDLGGANAGRREITIPREQVYAAMRRDLATVRALWKASA
jgi:L-ribulose-5-phosphate 3-epimerase